MKRSGGGGDGKGARSSNKKTTGYGLICICSEVIYSKCTLLCNVFNSVRKPVFSGLLLNTFKFK